MVTDDDQAFARLGAELADVAASAVSRWLERLVAVIPEEHRTDAVVDAVATAQSAIETDVVEPLRALLALDLDDQRSNPLAVLRGLAPIGTTVLDAAGALPADRDRDAVRLHPDDRYDLVPGSFADVDPALHEPGLRWGAAKAHLHLQRRRAAGQR